MKIGATPQIIPLSTKKPCWPGQLGPGRIATALAGCHYELTKERNDRAKVIEGVARTELLSTAVQIVRNGGETNLHVRAGKVGVWVVLGGQAAFSGGDDNRTVSKRNDAIVPPAGTKYWFESVDDEPLEIIRVGARDPRVTPGRVDVTRRELVERGYSPSSVTDKIRPSA